jgi:hypothetical protein
VRFNGCFTVPVMLTTAGGSAWAFTAANRTRNKEARMDTFFMSLFMINLDKRIQ